MKRPAAPTSATGAGTDERRRAAVRFGFSAAVASLVVAGLLILGAMFHEEYEEGFVRLVSYAVRLASPDELAQAEAAGPPPPPRPVARPDAPVSSNRELLLADEGEVRVGDILLPEPDTLIPIEDLLVETPEGFELVIPDNAEPAPETAEPE